MENELTPAQLLLDLVQQIGNEEQKDYAARLFAGLPTTPKVVKGSQVVVEVYKNQLAKLLNVPEDTVEGRFYAVRTISTEDFLFGTQVKTIIGKQYLSGNVPEYEILDLAVGIKAQKPVAKTELAG